MSTNSKIFKSSIRYHSKASERYIDVTFTYEGGVTLATSVPIEYRRTGTLIEESEVDSYLSKVYLEADPKNWNHWRTEQEKFWAGKPGAQITKGFFTPLTETFQWRCVACQLPTNRNWAKRVQVIKEFGYTLATNTKLRCETCNKNTTHIVLVPIKRGGITGYETWSPEVRTRIINLLKEDAFEAKPGRKEGLLPDHKFPEMRWNENTRRETLENLTDEEIQRDFQLLSNQRNQQKREVCRTCSQTGKRGVIYGIPFFYEGTEKWDDRIPKNGKEAEQGCVGCAWYDISRWRQELIKKLK